MKPFQILALALALLTGGQAFAAPIKPIYQDIKLPNQRVLEYQLITAPAAAGTSDILSAHAGATSAAAASTSTFVAQPDVARNIVITPGGTTADVKFGCTVTVTGTNIFNAAMAESFYFGSSGAKTGALAFKTISSVAWAANCEQGGFAATWSIGYGEKLGLRRCLGQAGHLVFSTVAGAYESTRATVAVGTSVQGNTADFNGTMNASNNFEAFFIQNFTCFP